MSDLPPADDPAGTAAVTAARHRAFAEHVIPEVDVLLRVAMTLTQQAADVEDLVLGEVFDHTVARAFDDLPEVFGSVVRLVDLDGLSYAEAARVLDVPTGTVMSRLHRGRARIRAALTVSGVAPAPARAYVRSATGKEAGV